LARRGQIHPVADQVLHQTDLNRIKRLLPRTLQDPTRINYPYALAVANCTIILMTVALIPTPKSGPTNKPSPYVPKSKQWIRSSRAIKIRTWWQSITTRVQDSILKWDTPGRRNRQQYQRVNSTAYRFKSRSRSFCTVAMVAVMMIMLASGTSRNKTEYCSIPIQNR